MALVSMGGSVDFMCFPRFDSPAIFAALLDRERGGKCEIAPATGNFKSQQRYLPDTNILSTRFMGSTGVAAVSDFMPLQHLGHRHNLVRRVKVLRGEVSLRMACALRFDHGRTEHSITRIAGEFIFAPKKGNQPALRFRSSVPAQVEDGAVVARFKLRSGETASFVLEEVVPGEESPTANPDYVSDAFKETMNFWLTWTGRSLYRGRRREMVNRSALTPKLLTSKPHGSLVAAPTFGLPEKIGGERNWDHRYTWIPLHGIEDVDEAPKGG
jgi:GH15 family glucan-1,4-alpha-glucosidase